MHEVFQYISDNFDAIISIIGCVIVGASAACALIPGGGWVKQVLAVLALNVKNATPEQIAKAKAIVDSAAAITKTDKK